MAEQRIDKSRRQLRQATPRSYEVGYARPPVASRFQPGTSGNPKGRPKGSRNKSTSFGTEQLKMLILEEAYRQVPIVDNGRRVTIPIATAVLRAVALNAAKGNNRAATLFTTLVNKTEEANHKLAAEAFGSAIDYKQAWTRELERRRRLGLDLPDPVPHPDDIVLDARRMTVEIRGPATKEEIARYKLGGELLAAYEEIVADNLGTLSDMPEGPERQKLLRSTKDMQNLCTLLRSRYGSRRERTRDPLVRDVEEILGVELPSDEED